MFDPAANTLDRLNWNSFDQVVRAIAHSYLGLRFGASRRVPGRSFRVSDAPRGRSQGTHEKGSEPRMYLHFSPKGDTISFLEELVREVSDLRIRIASLAPDSLPSYLFFATSSQLAVRERLEVDQLLGRLVSSTIVQDHLILDRDQILTKVSNNSQIQRKFNGLLSTRGPFHGGGREPVAGVDLASRLQQEMRVQIRSDRLIRLSHAGGPLTAVHELHGLGRDLPAEIGESRRPVLKAILERADEVLSPSVKPGNTNASLLLVGGPGRGKTTITQLLAQTYRASLLETGDEFDPEVAEIQAELRKRFVPRNRRWPLRVELHKFSTMLGASELFETYLSEYLSRYSTRAVSPEELSAWFDTWPSLLILDGLDEIPVPAMRERVLNMLEIFTGEMRQRDADVLVVVSSRPRILDGLDHAWRFEKMELSQLTRNEALGYAESLIGARLGTVDPEAAVEVRRRVVDALDESLTSRLMTTPLQVTILYLLIEAQAAVPRSRFSLFESFYRTIYKRERDKPGELGALLGTHEATVTKLHELLGLELQAGEADSIHRVSADRLLELAIVLLTKRGYSPREAEVVAGKVVTAARERLVLVVPEEEGVAFELRSLQEYMAARALTSGADESIRARLRDVAPYANWRYAWLLAVGRLAVEKEHLMRGIINDLSTAREHGQFPPLVGPQLAIDLIDDGIAADSPADQTLIMDVALSLLAREPTGLEKRLAAAVRAAWANSMPRATIMQNFREGMQGNERQLATTHLTLRSLKDTNNGAGDYAGDLIQESPINEGLQAAIVSFEKGSGPRTPGTSRQLLGDYLSDKLKLVQHPELVSGSLKTWLLELNSVVLRRCPAPHGRYLALEQRPESLPKLAPAALQNEAVLVGLGNALTEVGPSNWIVSSIIRQAVRNSAADEPPDDFIAYLDMGI